MARVQSLVELNNTTQTDMDIDQVTVVTTPSSSSSSSMSGIRATTTAAIMPSLSLPGVDVVMYERVDNKQL
ncbi:unnamed protein product [Adineta steineri]|uniref:Uncharacterized protein n=1 Tax=Adineta steineri TaxID=433720 RepID=A0A815JQG2_9BILA|nr:unnamed protein product [Adineta steineri]CAF3865430.1 unnamed protein product [Adineta steineri]